MATTPAGDCSRASPVFAAEQVEGWSDPRSRVQHGLAVTPIDRADALVAATGAAIVNHGSRAFYRPSTDSIHLPPRDTFIDTPTSSPTESYYAVLLHELTHWSSHERRCDRQLGKRFGDEAYAMEELVAELGAAFICADLDLTPEPRPDPAHYLDHWLAVMKADKRAIFTASKASEAARLLTDFHRAVLPCDSCLIFRDVSCVGRWRAAKPPIASAAIASDYLQPVQSVRP